MFDVLILTVSLALHHSLGLTERPGLGGGEGVGQVHWEVETAWDCLSVVVGAVGGNAEVDDAIFLAVREGEC